MVVLVLSMPRTMHAKEDIAYSTSYAVVKNQSWLSHAVIDATATFTTAVLAACGTKTDDSKMARLEFLFVHNKVPVGHPQLWTA